MDWGRKWLVNFNSGKTQLALFDRSGNTGAVDGKKDVSGCIWFFLSRFAADSHPPNKIKLLASN